MKCYGTEASLGRVSSVIEKEGLKWIILEPKSQSRKTSEYSNMNKLLNTVLAHSSASITMEWYCPCVCLPRWHPNMSTSKLKPWVEFMKFRMCTTCVSKEVQYVWEIIVLLNGKEGIPWCDIHLATCLLFIASVQPYLSDKWWKWMLLQTNERIVAVVETVTVDWSRD